MRTKLCGLMVGLLLPGTLLAQDAGTGVRRTLGQLPRSQPSGATTPASGGQPMSSAPASSTRRSGASGFIQPQPAARVVDEAEPAVVVDEAATAPATAFGTGGIRPRMDTATRFSAGDGAQNVAPTNQYATETAQPRSVGSFAPSGTTRTLGSPTTSRTLGTRTASTARSAAPVATTPADAASPVAELLLGQSLQPRAQHELPGQPLPLAQVFERTTGTAQRIKAVQMYWKLVAKLSAFHGAIDDRTLVQSINVRQMSQHDKATLAAAQMSAEANVRRAELEFITAQNELIEGALLPDAESQPLPSDVPLVSEYRTHFTTLYGERAAPSGLRRLDRALPYHLKDVRAQADAVVAAQQAVQTTAEAVSSGEATVTTLIEVQRMLARERANFTNAVFEYNAMIAEYALHVAPGSQSLETLVGMLIKTKPAVRSAAIQPRGDVRTVAGEEVIISEEILPADTQPRLAEPQRRFPQEAYQSAQQPQEEQSQPVVQQPSRFQYNVEPAPMEEEVIQPQPGEPNAFNR